MPRKKHPLRAAASGIAAGRRLALPALVTAAATLIVGAAAAPTADAKSPGTRYCFHGYCHRVGTLAQTDTLVGWRGYLLASYYDSCHRDPLNPCGSHKLRGRLSRRSPGQRRKPAAAGRDRHPRLQSQDQRRLRAEDHQRRPLQRRAQARRIARRRREARLPQARRGGACHRCPAVSDKGRGELRGQARVPKSSGVSRQFRDRRHRTQERSSSPGPP